MGLGGKNHFIYDHGAMSEQPVPPAPSKIVAVHSSYRSRAMERGSLPAWPSYFLKPPSTLAADGDPVLRPPGCELPSG
jgi:2-keto-4-pentenoate hydratase/2-oxohepta-3-ene-1,7-dioic acid hydratase in catechol pathway